MTINHKYLIANNFYFDFTGLVWLKSNFKTQESLRSILGRSDRHTV